MDEFLDNLDKISPIIYVAGTAIAGIYFELKNRINKKKNDIEKSSLEKRKEIYLCWVRDESRETIKKIKDLCNLYKDKTDVDLVHYLQFENGTVATSKLHNMFVSCLAEDSRFGKLPKLINHLQRIPYSNFSEIINDNKTTKNSISNIGHCEDVSLDIPSKLFLNNEIRSYIYIPIHDMHNNIIGVGIFYFAASHFNNKDLKDQKNYLRQFQSGVEAVFFDFLMNRNRKRDELLLGEGDIK